MQCSCLFSDDMAATPQQQIPILHSFRKILEAPDVLTCFDILASIDGNRVHKKRLQILHKASGIRCLIESDSTLNICESSQLIRNCISLAPIC